MDDSNVSFLLYIADQRETLDVKREIEKILNFELNPEVADSPRVAPGSAFEADLLGLYVSFRRAPPWPDSNVYRFAGGTNTRNFSTTGTQISIDSHVARALNRAGFDRVMSREEFATLDPGNGDTP
jgi:hypothetical protein